MRVFLLILFIVSVFLQSTLAQGLSSNWYFGDSAAIRFDFYIPTPVNDNALHALGSASISTIQGELEYYTNNFSCYSSAHGPVVNGTSIMTYDSQFQGVQIIPNPIDPSVHYLFNLSGFGVSLLGLRYAIIEKTLAHPLGRILPASLSTFLNNNKGAQSTMCLHANGHDIWLIIPIPDSDTIKTYRITDAGVQPTPVISIVDSIPDFALGQAKTSPDGKYLAMGFSQLQSATGNRVMFCRFNNQTGIASNAISFDNPLMQYVGCEFSPDSRFVYFSKYAPSNQDTAGLIQFNLDQYDSIQIALSADTIHSNKISCLQLGIDGNIYAARLGQGSNPTEQYFLGRINQPSNAIAGLTYDSNALYLSPSYNTGGLPGFISSYFHPAYFEFSYPCFGDSVQFYSRNSNADSVAWNFGEPSSGALNLSKELNPKHLYNSLDSFEVTLISYTGAVPDTFSRMLYHQARPTLTPINDTTFKCSDENVEVDITAAENLVRYYWNTGSESPSFSISDSGLYSFAIYNGCDTLRDTFRVIDEQPISLYLPIDTHLCQGDSLILAPQINASADLLWSDGSTDTNLIVGDWLSPDFQSQLYWLEASNACGTVRDSVLIDFIPSPDAALPPDSAHCLSSTVPIQRPDQIATKYAWHDGSDDIVFIADRSMTISLSANNVCGIATDSMSVTFHPEIKVSLGEDRLLCPGDSVVLNAGWPGASYAWSPIQSTDSLISVQSNDLESGVTTPYSVTVTTTPCSATATTLLTLKDEACDSNACKFSIPNVFSPNTDGINDQLNISNSCESVQFEVFIYNRWGQLVFSSGATNDARAKWDGFVNGEAAAEGTYFANVLFEEGKVIQSAVLLVR